MFRGVSHDRDLAEPDPEGQGQRGRSRSIDKAWAHRMLLLRGGDNLSCRAALRLKDVFTADDPTGTLQAVRLGQGTGPVPVAHGSLEDAAAVKVILEDLVEKAARPETNRLYHIKRTARGYRNATNYKSVILLRGAARMAA
jgi:hypothetical protein